MINDLSLFYSVSGFFAVCLGNNNYLHVNCNKLSYVN